ncbi:MAG: 30S ribosomal protein S20 [Oscillospiraceae bacterium]|nr:30S ribosomal protein S20 [Oscillospiraceae bacterium]
MANIKSSSKRILISEKAAARNKAAKSLMKTNIKKFNAAALSGDVESAESAYKIAVKTVDRAATKGLVHKNKAARRKSVLTKRLNQIQAGVKG